MNQTQQLVDELLREMEQSKQYIAAFRAALADAVRLAEETMEILLADHSALKSAVAVIQQAVNEAKEQEQRRDAAEWN